MVIFSACGDDSPQPVDMPAVKDMPDTKDMQADVQDISTDTSMDMLLDMPTDSATDDMMADMTSGDRALTVRLIPVEWGLFAQPVDMMPLTFNARGKDRFEVSINWPAGVWHVEVEQAQSRWTLQGDALTGLARQDDALVVADGVQNRSPIFTVVDEPVILKTDLKTISIERTTPVATARTLDQIGAPNGTVGPFFDDAIYNLNTSNGDPFEVVLQLMRQLHATGASPVISSRGAFFLAPGQDNEPAPEVRGTFTNWDPSAQTVMRRLTGRLWGRFVPLDDAHHQYKLVFNQGGAWFTDLSNRHIQWDGINTNATGDFNSVVNPQSRPASEGRMVWWPQFESPELNNQREVYIHLPPHYDDDQVSTFASLYIHDGNESIVRSQFHQVIDQWTDKAADKAVVSVFVALPSQDQRFAEYTMGTMDARGDAYAKFIAQTLTASVDQNFRTRTEAKARGVTGASLGGLISFWIALNYPTTFEYTAGMSSSFFWENELMIKEVQRRGCQNLRYYIDSGSPRDNRDVTRIMRDTLSNLNCTHHHVEEMGGRHEWSFWKNRFPGVLDVFYDGYRAR